MIHASRSRVVWLLAVAVLVLGGPLRQAAAQASPESEEPGVQMVGTGEIAAQLVVGEARERITGRVSFHLIAMPKGEVAVRGFNVVFFGVPQKLLGTPAPNQDPLGMLGFALAKGKPQVLRRDAKTGRISGDLRLFADASYFSAFARPVEDGKRDIFETATVPVTSSVTIDLEGPLPGRVAEGKRARGGFDLQMRAEPFRRDKLAVAAFSLRLLDPKFVTIEVGHIWLFEVAQRLCVQPVRLLRLVDWFIAVSGAGLPFGEPGARTQWAKADVVFDIRDWKTVWASDYWVLSESEADGLRSQVEDDDCVEVFFPYNLSPESMWGGGATWGCGTASAQIISSDANARYGIDLTHLAHELGHVLGLHHPGAVGTASCVPASTGTLLCPSGFKNDNPRVNSQENKTLLTNPLLTYTLKLRSPGPDCQNDTDCGACP